MGKRRSSKDHQQHHNIFFGASGEGVDVACQHGDKDSGMGTADAGCRQNGDQ